MRVVCVIVSKVASLESQCKLYSLILSSSQQIPLYCPMSAVYHVLERLFCSHALNLVLHCSGEWILLKSLAWCQQYKIIFLLHHYHKLVRVTHLEKTWWCLKQLWLAVRMELWHQPSSISVRCHYWMEVMSPALLLVLILFQRCQGWLFWVLVSECYLFR